MLHQLMDKGLVRIAGREDSLGRPVLYATTRKFLQLFGLRSLRDLPQAQELAEPSKKRKKTAPDADT
jgi:segregation and condensation protein B